MEADYSSQTNVLKPAVPIAGKYRLVDIPISNCLNLALIELWCLRNLTLLSLNSSY